MERMRRIFLDTNQWNYLFESEKLSDTELRDFRERLAKKVREGEIEIVASLPVLQEIVSMARRLPEKYQQVSNYMFKIVGNKWLHPLNERYAKEVMTGEALEPTSRYLSRDMRRQIQRSASRNRDITEVGDETYKSQLDYKKINEQTRADIKRELSIGDDAVTDFPKAYGEWWAQRDHHVDEWGRAVIDEGVKRKLISPQRAAATTASQVPSLTRYLLFRLAKVKLNVGNDMKIQGSDEIDADVFGCSPYVDIIVTDDKGFHRTCSLIKLDGLQVINGSQFRKIIEE